MRQFTIVDVQQGSEAWRQIRLGRWTGSVAHEAFAKVKGGGWAASRRNLIIRLALERLTGRESKSKSSEYKSDAMQDGHDREPLAIGAYEALTGELVSTCGFLSHNTLMVGCSPDGYVGAFDKVVSIKCRQPAAHWDFLCSGVVPGDALIQIKHEVWITGAAAADYFDWNPDFPARGESKLVTLTRAELEIPEYEAAALTFLREVETQYDAMRSAMDLGAVLEDSIRLVQR